MPSCPANADPAIPYLNSKGNVSNVTNVCRPLTEHTYRMVVKYVKRRDNLSLISCRLQRRPSCWHHRLAIQMIIFRSKRNFNIFIGYASAFSVSLRELWPNILLFGTYKERVLPAKRRTKTLFQTVGAEAGKCLSVHCLLAYSDH